MPLSVIENSQGANWTKRETWLGQTAFKEPDRCSGLWIDISDQRLSDQMQQDTSLWWLDNTGHLDHSLITFSRCHLKCMS